MKTTWKHDELADHFEWHDFLHPYAIVTRLADGVRGTIKWIEQEGHWVHFERLHDGRVQGHELTPKTGHQA